MVLSWRRRKIWLPRSWKMLRYSMFFFALVCTGKCCSQTMQVTEGKGRGCENEEPPAVGRIQIWDHTRNVRCTNQQKLMGYIHGSWGNCQRKWLSHNSLYLTGCGSPFLKRNIRRTVELQLGQSHLCAGQDQGADPYGNYAKSHGRPWGDWWQPTWLH